MNKTDQPGQQRDSSPLIVSVTLDAAPLLTNMVEKLAHRRYQLGFSKELMPEGFRAVDSSTIEAYVSGCMDIEESNEYIALSYTTCFSFTCTRVLGGPNKLCWVNSLS